MTFRVFPLQAEHAPFFAAMTRREHQPLLSALPPEVVALGAAKGEEPAGLVLARLHSPLEAELLSIFTVQPLWGRGLGFQLLQLLEGQLRARGVRHVWAMYNHHGAATPRFERLVAKAGWTVPRTTMHLMDFVHGAAMASAGWPAKLLLPAGYEVFPWCELTTSQRSEVEALRSETPPEFWPLGQENAPVDPASALGVHCQGRMAGWMLTHRMPGDQIRYTTLYLRPAVRTRGATFALAAESLRRALAAYGPEVVGTLAVMAVNTPMVRVFRRSLAPHAQGVYEVRRVERVLHAA